ncbi:MAG: hypothetical protein ABIQ52_04575 [Vicinamibacterales bacterium]
MPQPPAATTADEAAVIADVLEGGGPATVAAATNIISQIVAVERSTHDGLQVFAERDQCHAPGDKSEGRWFELEQRPLSTARAGGIRV